MSNTLQTFLSLFSFSNSKDFESAFLVIIFKSSLLFSWLHLCVFLPSCSIYSIYSLVNKCQTAQQFVIFLDFTPFYICYRPLFRIFTNVYKSLFHSSLFSLIDLGYDRNCIFELRPKSFCSQVDSTYGIYSYFTFLLLIVFLCSPFIRVFFLFS